MPALSPDLERIALAIFDTAIDRAHWNDPQYAGERAGCIAAARAVQAEYHAMVSEGYAAADLAFRQSLATSSSAIA